MAGSAIWPTQEAVYTKLAADSTLQTLLGGTVQAPRVFDAVPENQDFPFAVIGQSVEAPNDTYAVSVKDIRLTVLVFSRYLGSKEIVQAMDRAAVLLDGVSLTITGYSHIRTIHTRTLATRENDGVTRRGELEFQILVRQS